MKTGMMEYTHLELDQDVTGISGHYTPLREEKLDFRGREVLYVVGQAVLDGSCCGFANFTYILVPGYVVGWQKRKNEHGLMVSAVEPVTDKEAQQEIKEILSENEHISRVEFW